MEGKRGRDADIAGQRDLLYDGPPECPEWEGKMTDARVLIGPVRDMLEMIEADRTLVFSRDYPQRDADVPTEIARGIPERMRRRIVVENARDLFGARLLR